MGVATDAKTWHRARRRLRPWVPVVHLALDRALLHSQRSDAATSPRAAPLTIPLDGFVAESPAMQAVAQQIDRIRTSHSPVLITGERGVGKAKVAEAVYRTSTRADGPVAHIRCASMQRDPLEIRLFGQQAEGTLTPGAVHDASGGTLVFHDVDALSDGVQASLLRLLDTGAAMPVGGTTPVQADVRIIALTSADLAAAVQDGSFREALYHRLNVIHLRVPPLKERREDIPLLARSFLNDLRPEGTPLASITSRALDALVRYDWPGNIRQLRNEIERAMVFVGNEPAPTIDLDTLSDSIADAPAHDDAPAMPDPDHGVDLGAVLQSDVTLQDVMAHAETAAIERALQACDGQVTATADLLGLSRQGLYKKMKRLDIDPSRFQPNASPAPTT
jgi:DNA-binding NtrC family response regulator